MAKAKREAKGPVKAATKDYVLSITVTGSGGKPSKELQINFKDAGTLVVAADVAGGAFSAFATLAQTALTSGAAVEIMQGPPATPKGSPRLTQLTLYAPKRPVP